MLRWERHTDHRYYKAWLQKDLLGDIHLMCCMVESGPDWVTGSASPVKILSRLGGNCGKCSEQEERKGMCSFPRQKAGCKNAIESCLLRIRLGNRGGVHVRASLATR